MISYNNSDIIQCLRQYDMFANSLKLVYSEEEKKKIINQLNKLLEKNLNLTNANNNLNDNTQNFSALQYLYHRDRKSVV